jgi:hypothetical protein
MDRHHSLVQLNFEGRVLFELQTLNLEVFMFKLQMVKDIKVAK